MLMVMIMVIILMIVMNLIEITQFKRESHGGRTVVICRAFGIHTGIVQRSSWDHVTVL